MVEEHHSFICLNYDFHMIQMIFMSKKNHMNQNNHTAYPLRL
jgi:hypothetical protein